LMKKYSESLTYPLENYLIIKVINASSITTSSSITSIHFKK